MNLTRRSICLAALMGSALSGCDASNSSRPPLPAQIDARTTCDLDGMLLADYAGPKAQIHYAGQEAPLFCCDTVEMFHTLLAPEQVKPVRAVYVQDMGKADWEQPRGNWIDARSGWYVLGSKRQGSMGPTVASFALEDDARKFAQRWGGKLLRFAEVTPQMVDLSGGALHDAQM